LNGTDVAHAPVPHLFDDLALPGVAKTGGGLHRQSAENKITPEEERMQTRRTIVAALAAAPVAAALPRLARADEPVKIRMAYAAAPAQLVPVIFQNPSILKHYGKSYTVETQYFRGSSPELTALGAGDIDIAALAFSTFGLAIQNAHMEDLRLIGDLYQDGVGDHYSSEYMVGAKSGIQTPKDLKGKRVASNGIGGAIDIAMRKMLRDAGLEDQRDYTVIEAAFPTMPSMLETGKVDLAGMIAPFSLRAKKTGTVRPLFTMKDSMGVAQTTLMAARAPFIAKNRAALVDFFEDAQIGTKWFLDSANRKQALEIVSKFTRQPVSAYEDWLFTKSDYYRDPEVRPNLKALQSNLDVQKDLGFLKIAIDANKYSDLSLVNEAAKRHGA
jgi:sulfonate transport system substrate-binding protein